MLRLKATQTSRQNVYGMSHPRVPLRAFSHVNADVSWPITFTDNVVNIFNAFDMKNRDDKFNKTLTHNVKRKDH